MGASSLSSSAMPLLLIISLSVDYWKEGQIREGKRDKRREKKKYIKGSIREGMIHTRSDTRLGEMRGGAQIEREKSSRKPTLCS